MTYFAPTPSQTVGPYLHIAMPEPEAAYVVPEGAPDSFRLTGRLFDGDRNLIPDGLIETWQADALGYFSHPDDPRGEQAQVHGFGQSDTRQGGVWQIHTIKPGRVPAEDGALQAPHINVSVFARGLLNRLVTRVYFEDEESNASDPVLNSIDEHRRETLIARRTPEGYHFDIVLQGDNETVFFAL